MQTFENELRNYSDVSAAWVAPKPTLIDEYWDKKIGRGASQFDN